MTPSATRGAADHAPVTFATAAGGYTCAEDAILRAQSMKADGRAAGDPSPSSMSSMSLMSSVRVEVVGMVETSYRFNGLADYQCAQSRILMRLHRGPPTHTHCGHPPPSPPALSLTTSLLHPAHPPHTPPCLPCSPTHQVP